MTIKSTLRFTRISAALGLALATMGIAQAADTTRVIVEFKSGAQAEAAAHDEAAPDCALCLACAAAAHLAAAAAHGMAAPPWSGGPAVATAGQALAARALSLWHNRGPPGPA